MTRRSQRISVLLTILYLQGFLSFVDLQAQPALEALLDRIPAAETGDSNLYSLTDVQYALGLKMDWNPLLRRAQLRNADNTPLLTLLADSETGRVGVDWVRWPEAPRIENGQLFVSREVLASLFARFPDLKPVGWEAADEPEDSIEEFPGEEPLSDPDSSLFPGEGPADIRNLLALVYPVSEFLVSASSEIRGASEVLSEALSESLMKRGIGLTSLSADAAESQVSKVKADALVAFRILSGTPVSEAAFFTYDSPSNTSAPSGLTEWGRVDPARKTASRRLAQKLNDRYLLDFGESRTLGLRSGPVGILQGRSIPSVMVSLGIDSASSESEIRKVAETVAEALSTGKEEG